MTRHTVRFPALEGVFDRLGENIDHYAWIDCAEDAEVAMSRLVSLVADTMQSIAADITDRAGEQPGLTPEQLVADLRERAIQLDPASARRYDPETDRGTGEAL